MALSTGQIQAIRDRVALGRQQGGSPAYNGSPHALYHVALDDLDALLSEVDPPVVVERPVPEHLQPVHDAATAKVGSEGPDLADERASGPKATE